MGKVHKHYEFGVKVAIVTVYKGNRSHGCTTDIFKVFISRARQGITPGLERKLKRRSTIESGTGYMKSDWKTSLNSLKVPHGGCCQCLAAPTGDQAVLLTWDNSFAQFVCLR